MYKNLRIRTDWVSRECSVSVRMLGEGVLLKSISAVHCCSLISSREITKNVRHVQNPKQGTRESILKAGSAVWDPVFWIL